MAAGNTLIKAPDGRWVAPDIGRVLNRGELVVALISVDSPPFFSEQGGVMVGTDIDLVRQIGVELGVPVRFDRSSKTFDGVVDIVAAGQADFGVGRLARTLKRAQAVHFSTSYMQLDHSLLINRVEFAKLARDQPVSNVVRNFTGTLGVIGGSAWEEFGRRNFTKAKIVPYANWKQVVDAVKKGEIVAAYRDEFEVRGIVRADPSLALTLRTVTFNDLESTLSLMVNIRDLTLLSFANEVIAQRPEKPTVASVLKDIK